jgi:hypothetical protein
MVPSPHDTLSWVTVPSGSELEIVSVMEVPGAVVVVDSVKLTVGARSVTVLAVVELFVVEPELSVAFT